MLCAASTCATAVTPAGLYSTCSHSPSTFSLPSARGSSATAWQPTALLAASFARLSASRRHGAPPPHPPPPSLRSCSRAGFSWYRCLSPSSGTRHPTPALSLMTYRVRAVLAPTNKRAIWSTTAPPPWRTLAHSSEFCPCFKPCSKLHLCYLPAASSPDVTLADTTTLARSTSVMQLTHWVHWQARVLKQHAVSASPTSPATTTWSRRRRLP